jgi:hypothetical protein
MILFETTPGSVLVMDDPAAQGVIPLVTTKPVLDFQNQKVLITGIGLAEETSHQFMHTLGGDIYIYVFGDRIGQLMISGLACASNCDDQGDPGEQHGFEQTMRWYRQNKMSARPDPVQILIGHTPLKGFLTGLQGSVADPNAFLMRFDLTLMVLPEKPDTQPTAPTTSNGPNTVNNPTTLPNNAPTSNPINDFLELFIGPSQ